jgi:hypothetical protein
MAEKRKPHIKLKAHHKYEINKFVQPQKKRYTKNLTNIIETIIKAITLLATIGLIFGAFTSYNYLTYIQQLSIYPELTPTITNLTTSFVTFIIFFLLFLIPFLLPYLSIPIAYEIKNKGGTIKNVSTSIMIMTPYLLFGIIILSTKITDAEYIAKLIIFTFLLYATLFCVVYIIKTRLSNVKNIKQYIIPYILIFIIFIIIPYAMLIYSLIIFFPVTSSWINDINKQYLFLYIITLLLIINAFLALYYIKSFNNQKPNNIYMICILPMIFTITAILFISYFTDSLSIRMLYPIRFVEMPKDSSWYLLHNNFQKNNEAQETNGINKNDLKKIKQIFNCSSFLNKQEMENIEPQKRIRCSTTPEQRNNALYGYMAWNLGDTKVFCPPTAENNKGKKEAAKLATECIVISGKSLQILNENYIDIMPKER